MVLPPARFAWFVLRTDWRWLAPLPFGLVLSFIFTLYGAQIATIEPEAFSDFLQRLLQNLLVMALAILVGTYLFAWGFLNYRDLATAKPIRHSANLAEALRLMWPLLGIGVVIGLPVLFAIFLVVLIGALLVIIHPVFILATILFLGVLLLALLGVFLYASLVQSAYVLDQCGFWEVFVRGWRAFAGEVKGVALLTLLAAGAVGGLILFMLAAYLVAFTSMGLSLEGLADELQRQGPPTDPLFMFIQLLVNSLSFAIGAWTQVALMRLYLGAKKS